MSRDFMTVNIQAKDVEDLRKLVDSTPYNFGCGPRVTKNVAGDYVLAALLTREQYEGFKHENLRTEVVFDSMPRNRLAQATIGNGDRFQGGQVAPRGLGSRRQGESQDLGGIMNVDEIASAIKGLATEYGMPTFTPPFKTFEGAGGDGGQVGAANPDGYHLYLIAGVHARERGGPDNLIYFISDLLYAKKHGVGLTYGSKSFTNAQVLRALSTGIVFYPLVNPDGVRYDQRTDTLWRKNRNTTSAIAGDASSIGVDINRNYDFLWDFRRYFNPSIAQKTSLASDDPTEETFHGVSAFSEPESRNVAWVFDQFPRIRYFLDIHSAAGDVLYNWGDDNNQATDPGQNFRNPAWDLKRGVLGTAHDPDHYKEYISQADWDTGRLAATRMASAMHDVGGRRYKAIQGIALYATSGSSDSYAFSRWQANSQLNKVYGFTLEFGHPTNFYPTLAEFQQNVIDTGAGFMEFCLAAADIGLV